MSKSLEEIVRERVKVIGEDEWTLLGYPQQLIDDINAFIAEAIGEDEPDLTDKWTPEVADSIALARRVTYGRNALRAEIRKRAGL